MKKIILYFYPNCEYKNKKVFNLNLVYDKCKNVFSHQIYILQIKKYMNK